MQNDRIHTPEAPAKYFCGKAFARENRIAIGKLFFSGMDTPAGNFHFTGHALLYVIEADTPEDSVRSDLLQAPEIVGIICLDKRNREFLLRTAAELRLPLLFLSELPHEYHGKIAILDADAATLAVSPNLNTLKRYQNIGYAPAENLLPESPLPDTGILFHSLQSLARLSEIPFTGECLFDVTRCLTDSAASLPNPGEDEIFETCCELAGQMCGTPITVPISFSDKISFRTQARGVYRASVYGNFSLLCCHLCTAEQISACFDALNQAFCELKAEGREVNGCLPRGVLVDTPLLLSEQDFPDSIDFFCLDIDRLIALYTGLSAKNSPETALVKQVLERLKDFSGFSAIPDRKRKAIFRKKNASELLEGFGRDTGMDLFFHSLPCEISVPCVPTL